MNSDFIFNILSLMDSRGINTYKELSLKSNVNYSTIKSWLSRKSLPRLKVLDTFCDSLDISTADLFSGEFTPKHRVGKTNNSREAIRINLISLLRSTLGSARPQDASYILGDIMSHDTYVSYLRPKNGRSMSLTMLFKISIKLNVDITTLLMEVTI